MKKFYFFLVALVLGVVSASAADYYLIGGFNGWKLKDASAKFTASGNGEYVLDFKGELTSGFKLNDGTWGNDNINFGSNGTNLKLGEAYSYGVGGSTGNINLAEGAVSNPHIVLNPTAGTLTITGEEAEVKVTYVLWGNFPDGAIDWSAIDLEDKDNGLWVAENVVLTGACEFGIKENTNGAQSDWYAASGNSAITAAGVFPCTNAGGSNFSIAAGTWNFSFNTKSLELVVTGGGSGPVSSAPAALYVIGDFPGDETTHWNPSYGIALEKEGDVFTGEIEIETAFENDYGFFSLCTKLGSSSVDWSLGSRYGATTLDAEIVSGETYDFVKAAEPNAWKVLPGTYEITVDFTNNTIKLVGETNGIADAEIEDANVAPVYYNLQGVRVAEPANGLYIVVRGEKVTKELVK